MLDAEIKLKELNIAEDVIPIYARIILLSKSWESLKHLMKRGKIEVSPYEYLSPIITKIYEIPHYNARLKRITLMLRIPEEAKDAYFKHYGRQPEAFHRDNRDIPLAKRNKFIKASNSAVLSVIKDHLGFGPQYVIRNRISDAFDNP